MRQVQDLKSSGQALREGLLHEEWRGAEQHHFDRAPGARILVPEAFDGLGP